MIVLPGPEGQIEVKITLELIAAIEREHGSLYLLAEKLLDRTLTLTAMLGVLRMVYGGAVNDGFLLKQPCSELMVTVLLAILGPMDKLGAALPGEPEAARTALSI